MNKLNDSIIKIRVDLQKYNLKKSGMNKQKNKKTGEYFIKFEYFELKDFLPKLNELMMGEGINDIFTIENEKATLKLVKGEEVNEYSMPFERFETPVFNEIKSMQDVQFLGALNTYYKRYLYINAFGITDGEIIDNMDNSQMDNQKYKKENFLEFMKKNQNKFSEEALDELRKLASNKSKTDEEKLKEAKEKLKGEEEKNARCEKG